jgi:hypothetical protein
MDTQADPTLEDFIREAKKENWTDIDLWMTEAIATSCLGWAMKDGLVDDNDGVRDLAATFLDESDAPLGQNDQAVLADKMAVDDYHIVRYRLAVALYKRGNRNPKVVEMMERALEDSDIGPLALSHFKG